jgi:hypothetical protein
MSIPIDDASARTAQIVKLAATQDANGNTTETETVIVGDHIVDIQMMNVNDVIAADKLGIKASHKIYPERNVTAGITLHEHYYKIASKLYRIVWIFDYGDDIAYSWRLMARSEKHDANQLSESIC